MSLNAVIFGRRSKEYIQEFLDLPERIYARHEMMQNKEEERAILECRHALSHYFTATPILIYEDGRAVSRGVITVYPEDDTAYLGYFESENNNAAAGLLFHTAFGIVRDLGMKGIAGPIDCSFWIRYGLKTNRFGNPYTGESYNKDYYLRLWEENGFQMWEQYVSNHYMPVRSDKDCEKYIERLAKMQEAGYVIKSPGPREFRRILGEVYGLLMEVYSSFPGYKRITEKEFRKLFKYLKSLLNYSMVKMAYYEGEAVGFFISVPNFGNEVYGKNGLMKMLKIHSRKKKPESYVMLYMGVDPRHQGLGKALAEAVRLELKAQQVPSVGALIRQGSGGREYVRHLIEHEYEYVLLERQV